MLLDFKKAEEITNQTHRTWLVIVLLGLNWNEPSSFHLIPVKPTS
jgi:hypothetical protein